MRRWLILGALIAALVAFKVLALDPLWKPRMAPGFWRDMLDGFFLLPMAALALWAARRLETGLKNSQQDKP